MSVAHSLTPRPTPPASVARNRGVAHHSSAHDHLPHKSAKHSSHATGARQRPAAVVIISPGCGAGTAGWTGRHSSPARAGARGRSPAHKRNTPRRHLRADGPV
eukprot:5521876-Prymnesium_polylepis.1